ncbi:MAG: phenylalanine--tRNA ligase subunit beta, partial [Desulfosalsimonadaceae bacterium]
TLDGREHKLTDETLMICDGEKPVAVAGVMGGENSEIQQQTSRVLIESACFDPVSIRKTAKRMGISTDASHRFERGVDPAGTLYALERAARLMAEIGDGALVEGAIDEYPKPFSRRPITLDTEKANRLLGTSLAAPQMQELLESVDFAASTADEKNLSILPPSFRVDVSRPEDLMEEIARLWGYNRIITTFPSTSAPTRLPEREISLRETVKDLMCGFGFTESINYSFTAKDSCRRLGLPPGDERQRMLAVLNPLSEEQAVMRTSLLPGLLEAMHKNFAYQIKDLKLFETGRTFLSRGQDSLPEEIETLAALWTGVRMPPTWQTKAKPCDFYDIKGAAETLLQRLYIENYSFRPLPACRACYTRAGHSARISAGDTEIGLIGEIAPQVLSNFDLRQQAFILEIDLRRLLPLVPEVRPFSPIPKFPAASRDITLIVDSSIAADDIVASIYQTGEALLEQVRIFDLYSGAPIPEGKKSISIRLLYRSARQTLADETVNRIHEDITRHLMQTFHASLPA